MYRGNLNGAVNNRETNFERILIIFFYIFCFSIIGPLQSSMVAGAYCFIRLWKKRKLSILIQTFSNKWLFGIFSFQIFLLILSVLYPILHATYDSEYSKIIIAQILHIILGTIVISYIFEGKRYDIHTIIKLIIFAYLLQSLIELVASAVPSVASFTSHFSGDTKFQNSSKGTRGLGLSGSNGWGLSLSFGFVFLLYVKEYLNSKIDFKGIAGWFLLVLGTFFAGRTGLAGALLSIVYIFVFSDNSLWGKLNFISKLISILVIGICLVWIIFPSYVEFAILYLLPYALEPVFNFLDGNGLKSASTDDLETMWDRPMSLETFLYGDGYFVGQDGAYYLHTDVGVLRNLFFWGIGGYLFLIFYQFYLIWPMLKSKHYRYLMLLGIIYFALGEYKAMTIGISKMLISIIFLVNFSFVLMRIQISRTTR